MTSFDYVVIVVNIEAQKQEHAFCDQYEAERFARSRWGAELYERNLLTREMTRLQIPAEVAY